MARWKGFKNKASHCFYCLCTVEQIRARGIIMTVDHVIPRGKGGSNEEDNLVTACERCNNAKGDMLGWYEGCVFLEGFGNPVWFRDMLLLEEEGTEENES